MSGSQSPGVGRHSCPICESSIPTQPRYPTAVCPACTGRAVDERGRPLRFYNRSLGGGFQAVCASAGDSDTGEKRASRGCWIDGVRRLAGEAHLGGIVVYPL